MTSVCEGCGRRVTASAACPTPFRCPDARDGDDVDHLLVPEPAPLTVDPTSERTFVRFRRALAFGRLGLADEALLERIVALDDAVAAVAGRGFRVTPVVSATLDGLSLAIKDETGQPGGSHKGRHLMGVLLWLEVVEALGWSPRGRPLVIASCGNAALAAALLCRAAGRRLTVYVPEDADPDVLSRLDGQGATVERCPRRPGLPGDPSVRRLREAVEGGALPFTVQGPVNGLVLDGGRTLAWERAGEVLDVVVIQVGGGALASAVVRGLASLGPLPRIHLVQTAAVAPLVEAVERLRARGGAAALPWARSHRSAVMAPWPAPGRSVASGLLDDETWDWAVPADAVLATGGRVVAVGEAELVEARERMRAAAGLDASATGAAGLAGALALRREGVLGEGARVGLFATGH